MPNTGCGRNMQFQFSGQCQAINPPHVIIAVEPRENQTGKVGLQFVIPTTPPLTFVAFFERNQAEELLENYRKALDVAKGLSKK